MTLERVCLVIGGLGQGGTERQTRLLARGLAQRGLQVKLVILHTGDWDTTELTAGGVTVRSLASTPGGWPDRLRRLESTLRDASPQVVLSFLPVANVACALLAKRWSDVKLVWGVRGSERDVQAYQWRIRALRRLHVALASTPDLTICNSEAGRRAHGRGGGDLSRTTVVRNALDAEAVQFDPSGRERLRRQWNLEDNRVFTLVGNFDPVKGHEHFLLAASLVAPHRADARFVCVGDAHPDRRAAVGALAQALGLTDRLLMAGGRNDLNAVYSAADVVVSASSSEGLPNVLAEAMACQRVCVATDVGDSGWLVDGAGFVVGDLSSQALADGMLSACALTPEEERRIGQEARARVMQYLTVDRMIDQTVSLLAGLVA